MRFLIGLLVLAAVAAYFTKPEEADAEAVLREQVMIGVAKEDIGQGRSTAENLALTACKLRPNDCYDLLRSGLDVTYTDQHLFLKVDLEGYERRATCYGAFGQFVCPGGFEKL